MFQQFTKTEYESMENIIFSQSVLFLIFLFVGLYFICKIIIKHYSKDKNFYKRFFSDVDEGYKSDLTYIKLAFLLPTIAILCTSWLISLISLIKFNTYQVYFLIHMISTTIIIVMIFSYLIYCLSICLYSSKHKKEPIYHYNKSMLLICLISLFLMLVCKTVQVIL